MLWRPWGPLEHDDPKLPKLLESAGYSTAIVTDHYHYWEHTVSGYLQCFQSTEMIRGHEADTWQPAIPEGQPLPKWVQIVEAYRGQEARQYYANVKDFKDETDFFPAKVFTGAARWLTAHAHEAPFFLQVESYDVHEPWDVPEPYASMYGDPSLRDIYNIWPPYHYRERFDRFMAQTSPEELAFIRSQYAAKLTMVDHWLGELLNTVDSLNLWADTCIIIASDHGHDIGQHGKLGKQFPHYDTHAHIPLWIWHPQYPGNEQAIFRLTTTVDLFATILDTMGVDVAEHSHSRSLLPMLRGDASNAREALLYGTFGQGVCVTDGDWTVFKAPEQDDGLFMYSTLLYKSLLYKGELKPPVDQGYFIPHVRFPQWKVPVEFALWNRQNYLFNRRDDPQQDQNLWQDNPAQRTRMLDLARHLLETEGAPPEQFERLGL